MTDSYKPCFTQHLPSACYLFAAGFFLSGYHIYRYICNSQTPLAVNLIRPSPIQFSCSNMSNSLWPHGLQHARLPCPLQLLEPTKIHVHHISDAIKPSHPLCPFLPSFNLSQNQGLFQWVGSSHQVAKVLVFQPQHQSFQWIFRTDFL